MRRVLPLLAAGFLVAAPLVGCGESATSTPVAPDVKMPDTSKMSPEEIQKLHSDGSAGGSDRQRGATPGTAAPAGSPSAAPSDRGGAGSGR